MRWGRGGRDAPQGSGSLGRFQGWTWEAGALPQGAGVRGDGLGPWHSGRGPGWLRPAPLQLGEMPRRQRRCVGLAVRARLGLSAAKGEHVKGRGWPSTHCRDAGPSALC